MLASKLILNPNATQQSPGGIAGLNPQAETYNLGGNVTFGPFDISKAQGFGVYFTATSGSVTGILSVQGFIGDVVPIQPTLGSSGNAASNSGSGFLNTGTTRIFGLSSLGAFTVATQQVTADTPSPLIIQIVDPYYNIAVVTWTFQSGSGTGIIRVFTKGQGS